MPIPGMTEDVIHGHEPRAEGTVPGYQETIGIRRSSQKPTLVQRGEDAVIAATNAMASQIGLASVRIANAIGASTADALAAGSVDITSVEVSFGVTLATGLTTVFTAQAESSVVVNIVISRKETTGNA